MSRYGKLNSNEKFSPLPSFQFTRLVPRENLYSQISWQMIFRSCYLYISLSIILDYDFLTFDLREGKERKKRKKNWRFFPKELESLDKRFIYIERACILEEGDGEYTRIKLHGGRCCAALKRDDNPRL